MRSLLAVLIILAACTSSPTETLSADGTLSLRYGGTATVAGTRFSFTDVTDSRCPKEVTCVWAGDAAVTLKSGSETLVLHTNASSGPSEGKLGTVTMTLVELRPEPVAPGETKKSDYVVTIRTSS